MYACCVVLGLAAEKLKGVAGELASDLIVVMRVYFEKPRTTVGWKGLINDPDLTGTFNVNKVGGREAGPRGLCQGRIPCQQNVAVVLVQWSCRGANSRSIEALCGSTQITHPRGRGLIAAASVQGLKVARELLLAINAMGVPAGTEYLDTITPNFIADTIAWGAIGIPDPPTHT
jgi:hypothetical protein